MITFVCRFIGVVTFAIACLYAQLGIDYELEGYGLHPALALTGVMLVVVWGVCAIAWVKNNLGPENR